MTTSEKTGSRFIWDFLCGLKLTIFLLITLAVISIIGTIVPQGTPAPEYLQAIGPGKLVLYQALGFFDMYHSWWFILLLSLLSMNLVACSIKRLPGIWNTVHHPKTVLDASLEATLSNTLATLKTPGDAATLRDRVATVLKAEFADPVITEEAGVFHLFAQKAPWSRFAVYAVHLSVLVIFLGAIIGSVFGSKGYVNILEGESVDKFMSRSQRQIDLGFAVRCEKFSMAHYANGATKEYKSVLTVLENGQPVAGFDRVPIIVNDPLTYKGFTFYQSSYGTLGKHEFSISDPDGGNQQLITMEKGGSTTLPDGSVIVLQETTEDISKFVPGVSGAAAQAAVHLASGQHNSFVIYADNPSLNLMNLPFTGGKLLQYRGGQESVYTGLQVAKDPGVWVVWLGCLIMTLGIFVAFFMSHRRIWVRVENQTVTIAGNASKNQGGFQLFLELFVTKLKNQLPSEEPK